MPCLTKANQAKSFIFTRKNFEELKAEGKYVYLLNITDVNDLAIRQYIEWGEKLGVHEKYLTSHRTPWYALEKRPPAPILVTVFNRNGLRFIKNEANVRNLTCFHGFYPNLFAMNRIDILMAYLMTDVAREIFYDNCRQYGDGLEKYEPNDLNNAQVIDLQAIPEDIAMEILEVFQQYRIGEILHCPDKSLLVKLNNMFSKLLLT